MAPKPAHARAAAAGPASLPDLPHRQYRTAHAAPRRDALAPALPSPPAPLDAPAACPPFRACLRLQAGWALYNDRKATYVGDDQARVLQEVSEYGYLLFYARGA